MCFYLIGKMPRAKTAKRDIICFKIIQINYGEKIELRSLFYSDFEYKGYERRKVYYKLGRTYTATNYAGIKIKKLIYQLFYLNVNYQKDSTFSICEGFHSYQELPIEHPVTERREKRTVNHIVKCIIPKGTKYFENDAEYVSMKIKFLELI